MALESGLGFWTVGFREDGVVQDDVEFAGASGYGGAGFFQLQQGVLRAFVEADNAGYHDGRAFEVGHAAVDEVEADTYALGGVSECPEKLKGYGKELKQKQKSPIMTLYVSLAS